MDSCTLTADVTGRQHLRSATQRKLIVPRYRLNGFDRRRFAVAGPSTWNSLPDSLHDAELTLNTFKRQLKTHFYQILTTKRTKRIRDFLSMRYINLHFNYLLTYLLTYTSSHSLTQSIIVTPVGLCGILYTLTKSHSMVFFNKLVNKNCNWTNLHNV